MTKKPWLIISIIMVLGLVIGAACSGPSATPTGPTTTATTAPSVAPTSTVKPTVAPTTAPTATTPASTQVFTLVSNMGMVSKQYWVNSRYGAPLMDEIEKRSGGRIVFKRYWGSELFGAGDELKATSAGAVDFIPGWVAAYNINDDPIYGLGQVPYLWENGAHIWAAYNYNNGQLGQIMSQALEKKFNIKLLYPNTCIFGRGTDLYYKGDMIRVPADIKGRKLRATDAMGKFYVESVGCTGVYVTVSEAYLTMQRNIVTGAFSQNHSVLDAKWYEVTDKAVKLGIQQAQTLPVINRNTWDKLPADLQKIFLDVSKEIGDIATKDWSKDIDTVFVDDIQKANPNYKFYDLTPAERTQWRDAAKATWDYFAQLTGPTGNLIINIANATRADFLH